jgi:hypothetical protein
MIATTKKATAQYSRFPKFASRLSSLNVKF